MVNPVSERIVFVGKFEIKSLVNINTTVFIDPKYKIPSLLILLIILKPLKFTPQS